jgi:protein arginine N-methyltransferase 2
MLEEYLQKNVIFTENKLISELELCCDIMSTAETELMRETASILCSNSGSVLNVGFGMGIIDSYIREHNPNEHCIIEAHPQVYEKALEMGFNVEFGKWEDIIDGYISEGKTFDSIYFDTFTFDYEKSPQWAPFTKLVPKLLNPNGIYSYFNEIASKIEGVEEIIETFGWERYKKIIPFSRGDYELIWFVNK